MIRQLMEDYSRRRHLSAGYEFAYTPHITKSELFEVSGHLHWFGESMFPPMMLEERTGVPAEADELPLPHPDLPVPSTLLTASFRMRLFEFGTVYRYEKSGVVHGLTASGG